MARSGSTLRLSNRRRRQRSVRVSVAVSLLAVATVAVLASLPTQSPGVLSAASVLALALGWAALRITWTEVLQSRREHAADRAATASAYRTLFTERASEHAEFASVMTERLATSTTNLHELQAALVQAQRTAAEIAVRAESAESKHATALVRVAELERSIELLRSERDPVVEDLMAIEEKIAEVAGKHTKQDAAGLA